MSGFGFGLAFGLVIAVAFAILWRRGRAGKPSREARISLGRQIKQMQSIGELSVFRILAKEIVSAEDHRFGESGEKYWSWLLASKKMVMIFEFEVDFRYDLRDQAFGIREVNGMHRITMPPVKPEIRLRDLSFYDEQQGELLSWALPGLLSKVLGDRFDVKVKNQLKERAKEDVQLLAVDQAKALRSKVEESARQTLELIARGYGVERVAVDFDAEEPVPVLTELPQGELDS
jgi:hypothetical protein